MLELKNLSAGYRRLEILHDVTLRVDEKEIVSLIGANGAGKTTTLRAVAGIIKATSGEILLGGKPMHALRPDEIGRASCRERV